MNIRGFRNVRPLPERNSNGYAGFGYGGDRLYVAWNADCFDPPLFAVRADNFSDAYEVALNSLAPIVTEEDLGRPIEDFNEGEWADEAGIIFAETGEDSPLVWSENLMLRQVGGPLER